MTMQSMIGRFSAKLRQFRSTSGANVTILFALSLVPVAGAVAPLSITAKASSLRSAMQAAADAASLGTIKIASTLTPAQVQFHWGGDVQRIVQSAASHPTVSATYDAAATR